MTAPPPPPPEGRSATGGPDRYFAGRSNPQHQNQSTGQSPGTTRSVLAVTALVLGLLALVLSWTVVGGIVLGIAAIVVGILAHRRSRYAAAVNRGLAVAGAVLGALGLIIAVILLVFGLGLSSLVSSDEPGTARSGTEQQCLQNAGSDPQAVAACRAPEN